MRAAHELPIHPTATTVAVASGKGGVGKTHVTVALATHLATEGHDVVVVDLDVSAPNVTLASASDVGLPSFNHETRTLTVDAHADGYRVLHPYMFAEPGEPPVSAASLVDTLAILDVTPDYILFDLPPSWTSEHEDLMSGYVHNWVFVVAPTGLAIADHNLIVADHLRSQDHLAGRLNDDARRKQREFTSNTVIVENMASASGITADGQHVEIRLDGTVPAGEMVETVTSLPSMPVGPLAASPQIAVIVGEFTRPEIRPR